MAAWPAFQSFNDHFNTSFRLLISLLECTERLSAPGPSTRVSSASSSSAAPRRGDSVFSFPASAYVQRIAGQNGTGWSDSRSSLWHGRPWKSFPRRTKCEGGEGRRTLNPRTSAARTGSCFAQSLICCQGVVSGCISTVAGDFLVWPNVRRSPLFRIASRHVL